jgi:hypothetical protein
MNSAEKCGGRCGDLGKKGPAQFERWFRAQVVAEMTPKKIT